MATLERHSMPIDAYLRTPAAFLPWRKASFVVIGLETTGPDPHRDEIVSIAWVPVELGRAIIGKASELIVQQGRMQDALSPILKALSGRVLVVHDAAVPVAFLSTVLKLERLELRGPILDTAALAECASPRAAAEGDQHGAPVGSSLGLSRTASRMGLPVHRPHTASGKALTTAQLFLALVSRLERLHPQSVGSLAGLSWGWQQGASR